MRKILSYCHPSFSQENVTGSSNYKIIKSGRSLDLAFQLGAMTRRGDCHVASLLTMTMVGLFSFNAYATCTPTPDCDAIGYTETSCEGDSLKCPFDITKMMCMPCDSSFRYDCSGDNITGGTGSACGGKYVSCTCASGFSFENGSCICQEVTVSDCLVGAIYYPDGKCSNEYITCQNPVGIIVKDNEIIMSWVAEDIKWGGYDIDITDLSYYGNAKSAKTDYNGAINTKIIVEALTKIGETASTSAAIYCNEYAPTGMESTQGQWYLPAAGELYSYVHNNYNILSNTYITYLNYEHFPMYFWSSSGHNRFNAWHVKSEGNIMNETLRLGVSDVTCFLAIN